MPLKKKNGLEGTRSNGSPVYVNKNYIVHYGEGLRTICRLSISDTGPQNKRKNIDLLAIAVVVGRVGGVVLGVDVRGANVPRFSNGRRRGGHF